MKPIVILLLIAAATGLTACGKSEQAAAPEPSVAETPPAAPLEPAVEVAPAEPAPVAADAAPAAVEPPVPTPPPAPAASLARPKPPAPAPAPPAAPAPAPEPPAPTAPAPVADLIHGQKIYRQACAFCHDRGVAGAPKTGDAAAWSVRLARGVDALYEVAIHGKGAMPAKGGNRSLSDADVTAAVDYMIAQSR